MSSLETLKYILGYNRYMSILIDKKEAFVHVVYDYRCLVRAEYAYRESSKDKSINGKFPELGTVARNAVLSKARSLVDFYTKNISADPNNTDITFQEYFGGAVDTVLAIKFKDVKASMEVHDLHLTAWRDPGYRGAHNATLREIERQRIDWDAEQMNIVDNLIAALKPVVSFQDSRWEQPFTELHNTCLRVLSSGGDWETELNQENIVSYLSGLGL